jgi:NAD(P)-dependent dehydrogenase (short-subunit alcohol dehydrogenase family)
MERSNMARVLVTGSMTGLGVGAARRLIAGGHEVVLHSRSSSRAGEVSDLPSGAKTMVFGDLSDLDETRALADRANAIGRMDAVIHNAGVYAEQEPSRTAAGHPRVFAVNVLAPYLLSVLMERSPRLVYLSSNMHEGGRADLDDLDWNQRRWDGIQAYSDSKLLVTTMSTAIARLWPDVCSNAVNPGWVPTRMGGPSAPDDLDLGHDTQVWLATSDDRDALTSGGYWFHRRRERPADPVCDHDFQDRLLAELARMTGETLR